MQATKRYRVIILTFVWVLSALYVLRFVDRGWIPYDEGSLAQSAERVLAGELPHRDFDEIYTGGLSILYAAAFKILGVKLISIRIVLYLFFLAFVPALYGIALRFAPPLIAGAVTLLGVVWSVPNYFAGLPSWYNLFFATFGSLALIRHIETRQHRWLFIAGLWGGISFLAKLTGIYYVVAAFLFLTYREQTLFVNEEKRSEPMFSSFLLLKGLIYLLFIGSLFLVLRNRLGAMEIFHFLIPAVTICLTLLWLELREGHENLLIRARKLFGLTMPFCLGVGIPIALFLTPYVLSDSTADFYRGIFVLPEKRLQSASWHFPPFITVIASLPYALLLSLDFSPSRRPVLDKIVTVILIIALALALTLASNLYVYQFIWQSAWSLSVIAVITGCLIIARSFHYELISSTMRQILLLLVIMTGLVSLVQFPFPSPIYFCYTAPLAALTLLGVVGFRPNAPKLFHLGILGFYFLFALIWMNTGYVVDAQHRFALGTYYSPYRPESMLDIDRGGIRVPNADKELYTQLVSLARKHPGSGYIYAAPDCPEVYFLSGLRNPTRNIFDFLSAEQQNPADLTLLLENKGVEFVVVNHNPSHSAKLDPKILALLAHQFPRSIDLADFTARWRK